jgi:hypothetical protein
LPVTYQLQVDEGFGMGFVPVISGLSSLSFNHSSLLLGHTYTYKIRAQNLMGFGALSSAFSFIPRAVPSKPAHAPYNDLSRTNKDSLFISYNIITDDGGSPILNYNIYIDDGLNGLYTKYQTTLLTWNSAALSLVSGRTYRLKYSSSNI